MEGDVLLQNFLWYKIKLSMFVSMKLPIVVFMMGGFLIVHVL